MTTSDIPRTPAGPLLWVDDDYDRAHASDGHSRYSAYLRDRARLFRTEDGPSSDPGEFAQLAFTLARPPIMSPGYVRGHPRVCDTGWCWDDEGRAAVTLALVAPLPAGLAALLGGRWRGWQTRGHGARRVWVEPTENDRPAAYAALTLHVPINPTELPEPAYRTPDAVPDTGRAKAAVRAVCAQVNAHAAAVLAALEQDTPR
jgi:hypothetical protein